MYGYDYFTVNYLVIMKIIIITYFILLLINAIFVTWNMNSVLYKTWSTHYWLFRNRYLECILMVPISYWIDPKQAPDSPLFR